MWYTAKSISGKGFCRSVPMWRIAWAIKRTSEHDTSEHNTPTLWLSRWGARAEIRFIPDTKIAVYTPNAKWIQKCPHHAQHVVTKDDISAITGLPFSFSWKEALEDLVIEFYFPSRLHSSSFYTFYFFLHIFSVNSLLSCPLFHSDVRSNFRIAQSLFFLFFFLHCLTLRGGENLKVHLVFVRSSFTSFSHLRLWVASNTMTFWGKCHGVFVYDLSDLLKPLWTSSGLSSRGHFTRSLNNFLNCL